MGTVDGSQEERIGTGMNADIRSKLSLVMNMNELYTDNRSVSYT